LVPLAVWSCAQTSAQYQRAGRYLPVCSSHPGKMLPVLARRLVAECCPPGGLVADPMCGIGTTLVEAAAVGRHAVGVELEARWVEVARANLVHALSAEQAALAEVRHGDARRLYELLGDVAGRVDLVVTSPPYACDAGVIDKPAWRAGHPMCPRDTLNYSRDPANLGHARAQAWRSGMAEVLAGCAWLLRPGGLLVTVTKNNRRLGRLNDLATATITLAERVGFGYLQHIIALHAAVRGGRLVARPSFWQLTQTRKARARGEPAHLVVQRTSWYSSGSQRLRAPMAEPSRPDRSREGHPQAQQPLPLSVWPTAQQPAAAQRAGRYLPGSTAHPAKMLPAIARHAIQRYSQPGDLVLDPMCGIGTTLVEAIHLDRHAIGVELEPRWAELARANTAHARAQGAQGSATVVAGDARHLPSLLDPELVGRVALVLTSPPYGSSIHGQVTPRPGQGVAKYDNTYSPTPPTSAASLNLPC
jgi:modification methylase